jgi:hypothetical protein
MLGALILPGLALVPHQHPNSLAIPLVMLGMFGLVMAFTLVRLTIQLNPKEATPNPGVSPWTWIGRATLVAMFAPVILTVLSAWLVSTGRHAAFGAMALTEGLLLILPTGCAWLLVTHAQPGAQGS